MATLKTFPTNLNPPPGLPVSPHDPKWSDPEIAAKVAMIVHRQLRTLHSVQGGDERALVKSAKLPWCPKDVDAQAFTLGPPAEIPGAASDERASFRGGGVGELVRHYSGRAQSHYHAQWVTFGADSEGRWFVSARVGRVFGQATDRVSLVARFRQGDTTVGGVHWTGVLASPENQRVDLFGVDPKLAEQLPALTSVRVELWVDTHLR